jgi:regulator of nucleoside diphosphate kinase
MPEPSAPIAPSRAPLDHVELTRTPGARRALERFRFARKLVLPCVLLGAIAASHAPQGAGGKLALATGMACLALAVLIELLARAELTRALAIEAVAIGIAEDMALQHVRACLDRVLAERMTASSELPHIVITQLDRERLRRLMQHASPAEGAELQGLDTELSRAEVVASREVPPDVVTMNSRVCFEDEGAGVTCEVTLVYPQDADPARARVSVFSPVGSALLGLRVGQAIDWAFPLGVQRRFRVLAVPYQPEAAGDFDL